MSPRPLEEARPRLWVPGLVYVSEAGELLVGRAAGYLGRGPAFRLSACGRHGTLQEWRHAAWLVERTALHPSQVADLGIVLAEDLVDRDELPHAHRWLHEQPLVCVSGLQQERLVDAGLRVWRVELDSAAERALHVEADGGGKPALRLRVPIAALQPEGDPPGAEPLPAEPGSTPIGRLLRHVSHGVLDEAALVAALQARGIIEEGYGYGGAPAGQLVSMERIARELRAPDALFAQIYKRAATMREQAESLARALRAAPEAEGELGVPIYGAARAVVVPELRLRLSRQPQGGGAFCEIDGEPQPELVVPALRRWLVDGVTPWSPELPSDLLAELEASAAAEASPRQRGWRTGAALLGTAVALLLLAALLGLLW